MKSILKIITLILALLMLLSVLVACKIDKNSGKDESNADVSDVIETEPETEIDYYADIPTGDYDGYEFKIMVTEHGWAWWDMIGGIGTGNYNKDIYTRNTYVQEKLGITIKQDSSDGATIDSLLRKQAMSGDAEAFDAYWHGFGRSQLRAIEGAALDLNALETINFSKPWWYSDFNESIHLSEKIYCAFGSINTVYHSAFGLCAFNKQLLDTVDQNVDLYEVYNSGNWTFEEMFKYMKLASSDENGDAARKAADDYFGLALHSNTLYNFLLVAGELITEKGNDGIPVYVGPDAGFISVWEYVVDNMSNPMYTIAPNITDGYSEYTSQKGSYNTAFNEGRVLFLLQGAGSYSRNAGAAIEYGLIGYPKRDVSDEYISPIYFGLSGLCVSSNCPDPERTGTILENLCAYSYGTVDTGYIESVLYYKYAKDAQATETIAKAFENGLVDIVLANSWGAMGGAINTAMANRNRDVVSLFEGKKSKINEDLQKAIIFLSR